MVTFDDVGGVVQLPTTRNSSSDIVGDDVPSFRDTNDETGISVVMEELIPHCKQCPRSTCPGILNGIFVVVVVVLLFFL